jgi:hypothetical protein
VHPFSHADLARANASDIDRRIRAVVEVALDPPAGVAGGRDDAHARLVELDSRIDVGDRLRD